MFLSPSRRLTLKAGIFLLAWVVVAGFALADTVDLTDDMEVSHSPLRGLQQALEPDLDDLRKALGTVVSNIQFLWIPVQGIFGKRAFTSLWSVLPLSSSPRSPLYQRLSTYRI
jgi:hypothetical protein